MNKTLNTLFVIASMGLAVSALIFISISIFREKTDTFSGIYWCLTTAIYLAWSLWTMNWDITWIVWPVAGVLFAALLGVAKMVLKKF